VYLNLALCNLKLGKNHEAIYYCSLALDREESNEKALYRRGVAYLNINELNKAKSDLIRADQITDSDDINIRKALLSLQEKESAALAKERAMSQRMFHQAPHSGSHWEVVDGSSEFKGLSIPEQEE
jgi:tetratricopeptide (TPR) repeat protein